LKNLTLYLARHGESAANADGVFASHRIDAPLSSNGTLQARALARWLEGKPISAIYVSPLLRARQTAEIACAQFDTDPVFMDALAEIDVGELEGKPEADPGYRAAFDHVLNLWEQGFSNEGFSAGETLLDAENRLRKLLETIERGNSSHVLLVGHCLLFMALIWLFCENHGPTLENGHMGRGHLTIIRKRGSIFRLEEFDISPEADLSGS